MKTVKKAVIPAAGLGTRFLPATKAQPKEMLPIVDKPTIQFIIEEALRSGIEEILIITGRTKKAIEDHFDRSYELEHELERKQQTKLLEGVRRISNMANIYYVRQKEALGLGHAVNCARTFVGSEPFAVLLGDDIITSSTPALRQLMDVYEKTGSSVLGVQPVPTEQVSRYGIADIEGEFDGNVGKVADLIEKPQPQQAPSNIAIMGRYIITPAIFELLDTVAPGSGGEIQLTDALRMLLKTQSIYACSMQGRRFDVGDKLGYLAANVEFALARKDLSEAFADYLAGIALDKELPLHSAIAKEMARRRVEST